MNKLTSTPQFEENIRSSFGIPALRPEFVDDLHREIIQRAETKTHATRPARKLRPAWSITLAILTLLMAVVLIVGPQRVYAAVVRLLGYIPGVGIVDESNPIRVLAEPVSVTRDGITITVTSATLTGDKTYIDYRIFGVPGSAYPRSENITGCMQTEYLRLPDGTQFDRENYGFGAIPVDVDEAIFVIPCIMNTLSGEVPENWELPLRFVPAPADLTVIPVYEEATAAPPSDSTSDKDASATSAVPLDNAISVDKVIETEDGYILIGQFQPQDTSGHWVQTSGLLLTDASGKIVPYTYPNDVIESTPMGGWSVQFKNADLAYPLTISFSGIDLQSTGAETAVEFAFDAGPNPQPGDEWVLNRDFELASYTVTLKSIMANSQNSYSFHFQVDPQVYSVAVEIVGHTANGGGGGGGGGLTDGKVSTSLSYAQFPSGELTVRISNPVLIGDAYTWQGQWSPAKLRTDLPASPSAQSGVCLTIDSLAQLKPAPANPTSGMALMYEQLVDTNQWGLVLYKLDGSQKQVVISAGNWGTLSPDGSKVAYSALDNRIHIIDLASQTEKIIPGAGGFNLHWSPDGKQIAYVGTGDGVINSVFVVNTDGTQARQISDWSYELVAGWSPDSAQIYYVAPYTGGAAWKVYRYDLASSETQELFTIENGTPKALNPKLSPDGEWIAYRGRDNSSLYLVHPDGSDMHLVLDNVSAVGIEWSQSGWLGVSLQNINSDKSTIVLLKPDGCEAYQLPGLSGELEGLFIP